MDDLLAEFLTEATEGIELLDTELVDLEQRPDDPALIGNIFRVLHTIKGTSGFLDLPRLESVAHAGENVLGKFRDGELKVTPDAVGLILEAMDRVKDLVTSISELGHEPAGDDSDLIGRLDAGMRGEFGGTMSAPEVEAAPEAEVEPEVEAETVMAEPDEVATEANEEAPAMDDGRSTYERIGGLSTIDAICDVMYRHVVADERLSDIYAAGDVDIIHGVFQNYLCEATGGPKSADSYTLTDAHAELREAGMKDKHFDATFAHFSVAMAELEIPGADMAVLAEAFDNARGLVLAQELDGEVPADGAELTEGADGIVETAADADGDVAEEAAAEAAPAQDAPVEKEVKITPTTIAQSLRVNVDVLENLMTVVSELVLTRNQLMQILRERNKTEFDAPLQRLNQVTSELQESVMQTRMQPIGNAWNKLPRIVRDISHELNKKIELDMSGAETELDRQVLDQIKDPLTHMVRNSGDHGLETPEERLAAGKSETGKIKLSARHEGGHIIIVIADDGKGIPVEKIKAKAITNGLTTEADAENLTDQQILQFIFKPGFSTAEKVTNVSGRGVGMDVVRTNIAKIGGTVDLQSVEGEGSRFTIKIPLTLAIVQALIVQSGGDRFAIPQTAVTELVRTSESSGYQIERVNNTAVLRLRNRLLPLVSLRELLKIDAQEDQGDESYVVVARFGSYAFGIMVDQVFDTEEIVVKPVARTLRDLTLFSGNTILGDGSVVMILDPNGIVTASGNDAVDHSDAELEARGDGGQAETSSLLLFRAGEGAPKAFPLELVARIEEIDMAGVESANGGPVIQYREGLMPLALIDGAAALSSEGRRPVLVFSDLDRSLGLVVDEIVDIVDHNIEFEAHGHAPGILGSTIIGEQATDLLDAGHYLKSFGGDWLSRSKPDGIAGDVAKRRILLVEDSPFFRNLLTPLLQSAGYEVCATENADQALVVLEEQPEFDVIVSDIEMPGMNGLEFATKLRSTQAWKDTPLLALSSHDSQQDIDRGIEAGFDEYIAKADHSALIDVLSRSANPVKNAA
tara:strand:+ start:62943 stop:66038 length:3096 start_codon:yes stop_codon:yes gene_type:complete